MLIGSIHIVIVIIIYYVCALKGISFIISSIRSIIVGNREVRAVVCFKSIFVLYDSTRFIFLMNSHSYFITHNYYLLYLFYQITHTKFTVNRKAPKYRSYNKDKRKEYPSTKIPFVYSVGWPQWGMKFKIS